MFGCTVNNNFDLERDHCSAFLDIPFWAAAPKGRCPVEHRGEFRHVRLSFRPSFRPSVDPLRLCINRVSRLFLATVRSYTETNDQPTCFESLLYYSVVSPVCSSICLSVYVTWSIHAETQSGRIFARSGLFPSVAVDITSKYQTYYRKQYSNLLHLMLTRHLHEMIEKVKKDNYLVEAQCFVEKIFYTIISCQERTIKQTAQNETRKWGETSPRGQQSRASGNDKQKSSFPQGRAICIDTMSIQ